MASIKLENIKPDLLRWAFQRAGFNEEAAVVAFPKLADWLSGTKKPTMSQLQKFASKFHTPFGFLFLDEAPVEKMPIPMFRGEMSQSNQFDLEVYDTILNLQFRQGWIEEYLEENEIDGCPFVNCITLETPVYETVAKLRQYLALKPRWAFDVNDYAPAVNLLTQQIEENGVFVVFNGVVGNNNTRPIEVSECRGFALMNEVAPFIFVNSRDSKSAQLFTLIHEVTHIMLGVSAGHAGENVHQEYNHNRIENYCDRVAAEFLIPESILQEKWNGDIHWLSRRFKASEPAIARRAHDIGLMNDKDYNEFWAIYSARSKKKNSKSKTRGDFYLTSVKRVGRTFAIHVKNAVNNRQLTYTDAYHLTGLYGDTYQQFMRNNV